VIEKVPDDLGTLITAAEAWLATFDAHHWRASRGEGKWTRLEVLGHLIDSAVNNHQRFVRALAQPRLDWSGYDQNAHVAVQRYADEDPALCLALWAALNRHICHVLREVTPSKAATPCSIGGAPEMTLAVLALDYVAHLEHHLRQILDGREIGYSGMPWPPTDSNREWPV
jgi:hypothetical protein